MCDLNLRANKARILKVFNCSNKRISTVDLSFCRKIAQKVMAMSRMGRRGSFHQVKKA